MSKFIVGSVTTITVTTYSSQNATYPASNVADYWHLRRCYKSGSSAAQTITIDVGAGNAGNVKGVLIDDVNWDDGYVRLHSDAAFATYVFNATISPQRDYVSDRLKIYVPVSTSQRYIRVGMNTGSTFHDGTTVFRIGRIVPVISTVTPYRDPQLDQYNYQATYPEPVENKFKSGGVEIISNGTYKTYEAILSFPVTPSTDNTIWSIDSTPPDEPIVLYENKGDDSKAWLVRKTMNFQAVRTLPDQEQITGGRFTEII